MTSKKAPALRSIQILPQQPSKPHASKGPTANVSAAKPDSFFEAFGPIGILLLLSAGVSVWWTAWLIVLTIAPIDTANYLMDTAEFDDGHFWLIVDPEPEIMSVNSIVLVGLAVSYIHVMLKMTVLRNSSFRIMPVAASFWLELTGHYGQNRKFWVRTYWCT
ncbi:hypothetical protein PHYSODRAFT_534212 [Phytophthora sojae]|uniref:Uncharacterized protein n=1 Tax=Phytophthora sojae (strain P6497) TaxID=1094619 RepID=G5AG55_PHYSP|nr:hypothetical protein PHYSODRAFT_534212 [Phytophthora sojae]EGZ05567.1 hypothetical protein PHYSODRAFT_534212 [Phytophthora sojae]|eukprot:XP_009539098.1 hypothetical protein PHYSODRAFT_534212 [Phytophthora sojae]